jgi:[acyl-carrier-protein] S-malonyltransferase
MTAMNSKKSESKMADTKTIAMFPGQGSQYVGMAKILLDEFPYTNEIFEEAADFSKAPIRKLCLEGPDDQLKLTANTQPCIVATSVATWRVMTNEKGFTADVFAGHSLGEYSALVAAGRLKFSQAISLVRARGQAMQKAVPEGAGAMTAVLSMDASRLEDFCTKASKPGQSVEVVNYNSPAQLVVAGASEAVKRLEEALTAEAVKFVSLPVSAPFHSSMMKPAREEMTPMLRQTDFVNNGTRIIPNFTAESTDQYGADFLIQQIDSPVKWCQTIEKVQFSGINQYVEVGPGKVLWGLARRILPKGEFKLSHTDNVKDWLGQAH